MSAPEAFTATVRAVLGHAPEPARIKPGEFIRFTTNGKPGNRDGWLKLFADGRGGCFGCKRQGISDTWQQAAPRHQSPAARLARAVEAAQAQAEAARHQRQQWAEAAERNARLWAACRPVVPGDVVHRYLTHRLKAVPLVLPSCLRFHPGLDYWHDDGRKLGTFPAMVARFEGPGGELLALHRTYLDPSGHKANLPEGANAKKLTRAAGPLMGGCIPLATPTASGLLGVAEGIESALAASLAGRLPVVAAYCAGALKSWQWPTSVQHLAICGDADPVGRAAADELGHRALAAGLRVHVAIPSVPGLDWCDIWASRDECTPPAPEPAAPDARHSYQERGRHA